MNIGGNIAMWSRVNTLQGKPMTSSIRRFSHWRMSRNLVGGFIYVFMWSYVGFCWWIGPSDNLPMFNVIFLNDMVEVHQCSRYHWIHCEKSFPSYSRGCLPLYWEPEYYLLSADSSLSFAKTSFGSVCVIFVWACQNQREAILFLVEINCVNIVMPLFGSPQKGIPMP